MEGVNENCKYFTYRAVDIHDTIYPFCKKNNNIAYNNSCLGCPYNTEDNSDVTIDEMNVFFNILGI